MISSGVYRFLGMTLTSLVTVQSNIHPGPDLPGQVMPIRGFPFQQGIEDSITQACHDEIYPPITPYVRVFALPSNPSNVVAVVKVSESIEAPHAIQNQETVYVRVNSVTPPYKLAEIDRIAFLLERRQAPEKRRESLINEGWARISSRLTHHSEPRIRIAIGPRYPHKPVFDREALKEIPAALTSLPPFNCLAGHFRLTQDGIAAGTPDHSYLEINRYGFVFYEELLATSHIQAVDPAGKNTRLELIRIILSISELLRGAQMVLSAHSTNLLIKCSLLNVQGMAIFPHGRDALVSHHDFLRTVDSQINAETDAIQENLKEDFPNLVVELAEQLMWAFNWNDDKVREKTLQILRANKVL
jgi:hypothetical protein